MTNPLYSTLAWLPPAPADFSASCKQLLESPAELGLRAQRLANYQLDESQLNRLAKVVQRARAAGASFAPLVPFRLGIISNATTHLLVPPLLATALRHGIALECVEADYDQV